MTALKLRPYQTECLDAYTADYAAEFQRLATVLPTGMGKTVIMAEMADRFVKAGLGNRVGFFVHRNELVQQLLEKLHSVNPNLTVGVVKAGQHEVNADVVIMSIQTLAPMNQTRLRSIPADHFGLLVVDECHHAAARSYKDALQWFGAFDDGKDACEECCTTGLLPCGECPACLGTHRGPCAGVKCGVCAGTGKVGEFRPRALLAGFTATLERQDNLGLGDVFQKVTYKRDIIYGIRHRYLVDIRATRVTDTDALKGVTVRGGDYADEALGAAMIAANAGELIAAAYRESAADRTGILYAPNVASAHAIAEDMNRAGFPSATITGETTADERKDIFRRTQRGEFQTLVNCMVLTEGFDMPQVSCVVPRPTRNRSLFVQMVGRGARPWKLHDPSSPYLWISTPKTDCLVLDVFGATDHNKLATIADLSPTMVRVEPGETLSEAIEREQKESNARFVDTEKLTATDVDLFATSVYSFKRTVKHGYIYIPTAEWLIVVYPETMEPDTAYMVGQMYCGKGVTRAGKLLGSGLNHGYALAIAESAADEIGDTTISRRDASWKKKKEKPSDAQLNYARSLRINVLPGMTKVEVSDLIDDVVASRILDRYEPTGS